MIRLQRCFSLFLSGLLLAFLLAGCGTIKINSPVNSAIPIASPIPVDISWNADMQPGSSLEVFLDNADISSQFANAVSGRHATLPLTVLPGCHVLAAYARLQCSYCTPTPWARVGQQVDFRVAGGQSAQLALPTLATPLNAGASVTTNVSLASVPTAPMSVTLTPSNASIRIDNAAAGQPATVTITPPQTSINFTVTGVTAGVGTIAASNPCASGAQTSVTVRPVLTSMTPNTGSAGTSVTLAGQGFTTPARANFGNQGSNASNVSATSATVAVPAIAVGAVNVTVTANNQTSASSVPFTVTAAPVTPPPLVFRASSNDVQAINVSNPAAPVVVSTRSAAPSAGGLAGMLGLARVGTGPLIRAGSTNMEVFPVDAAGNIQAATSNLAVTGTATAVAVAMAGTRVIRGTELGIQLFALSGNILQAGAFGNGNASATGVGVAVNGNTVVRAVADGIEVWDISNVASPVRRGFVAQGGVSATGVDVKINAAGTRAVRSFSGGIDVYDISTPTNPILVRTNFGGGLSATRSTLLLTSLDTRAVRVYDGGIEVYDLTSPTLQRLGMAGGDLSPAGAAVVLSGARAVRSGASTLEVFDISTPASIVRSGSVGVTLSPTGVALSN